MNKGIIGQKIRYNDALEGRVVDKIRIDSPKSVRHNEDAYLVRREDNTSDIVRPSDIIEFIDDVKKWKLKQ